MWFHNQPPEKHLFYPAGQGIWRAKIGLFITERRKQGGVALTPIRMHVSLEVASMRLRRMQLIIRRLMMLNELLDIFEEQDDKTSMEAAQDAADDLVKIGEGYIQPLPEDRTEALVGTWQLEDYSLFDYDLPLGVGCVAPIQRDIDELFYYRHYLARPWHIKMRPSNAIIPLSDIWSKQADRENA